MELILKYIISKGMFLFHDHNFKFIDSLMTPSFGGSAYIILTNGVINIRLTKDRDGLFLDFQSTASRKKEWFSFEIVGRLLTENINFNGKLDDSGTDLLKKYLGEITNLFSNDIVIETTKKLKLLKGERAKKLFNPKGRHKGLAFGTLVKTS